MPRKHAGARTQERTILTAWLRACTALALPLLAFALAGCGPSGDRALTQDAPVPEQAAAAASATPEIIPASAEELLATVRSSESRAVVLNVWATWCGPCREEFPDLLRLRDAYRARGLELVLISGDFDDQLDEARAFLAGHGVGFRTYIKTGRDMAFINALNPEWSGALPATFIYDANGKQQVFWEGKASYEEMEQRLLPVLEGRPTTNL